MDAPVLTPEARRFVLAAFLAAVASVTKAQAPVEWIDGTGYTEPSVAIPVARVRRTALRMLAAPRCRRLFTEFKDLEGVPLDSVLAARGHTAEIHLQRMTILNGAGLQPCRQRDVYAFTSPGTLTVYVCNNFRKLALVNAASAASLLIHEMLHTLGAGEAPSAGYPTAYEITSHVESRCGR